MISSAMKFSHTAHARFVPRMISLSNRVLRRQCHQCTAISNTTARHDSCLCQCFTKLPRNQPNQRRSLYNSPNPCETTPGNLNWFPLHENKSGKRRVYCRANTRYCHTEFDWALWMSEQATPLLYFYCNSTLLLLSLRWGWLLPWCSGYSSSSLSSTSVRTDGAPGRCCSSASASVCTPCAFVLVFVSDSCRGCRECMGHGDARRWETDTPLS